MFGYGAAFQVFLVGIDAGYNLSLQIKDIHCPVGGAVSGKILAQGALGGFGISLHGVPDDEILGNNSSEALGIKNEPVYRL